jgi:hypothetical protein
MVANWPDSSLSWFWGTAFWPVAVGASLFYGIWCWTIHELDRGVPKYPWRDGTWAWKVHQVWLNFLGSLVGWYALWLFRCGRCEHRPIAWLDIALLVIAFLGMTGLIPHVSRYGSEFVRDISSKS